MQVINPIRISFKNLLATKTRSFLTILGIIIGVGAVIVIFAIGRSAQELILDQVRGVGSDLVGIMPGASEEDGPPPTALGISITTLTYDDLKELIDERNVPEVSGGAGYVMGTVGVVHKNLDLNVSITGTTASYIDIENAEVAKGRFFTEDEEMNMSRVAVVGFNVAKDLGFFEEDLERESVAFPKKIKIDDQNYNVIGILKERGSSAFGTSSQDDTIYVPLKTAQKLILGINHLGFIRLKVRSTDLIEPAKENIKKTLREEHNIEDPSEDDFSVRDQASAIEILGTITDVLRYFLLSIGVISLVVGGIGIMNIMLIAVNQRIHEVGLRKAIGAKNIDILSQFLVESATISFVGGVLGIILGIGVSFVFFVVAKKFGYDWQFIISPVSVIVAVTVSILVGIIFGLWPAKKASKISPMEALRYE